MPVLSHMSSASPLPLSSLRSYRFVQILYPRVSGNPGLQAPQGASRSISDFSSKTINQSKQRARLGRISLPCRAVASVCRALSDHGLFPAQTPRSNSPRPLDGALKPRLRWNHASINRASLPRLRAHSVPPSPQERAQAPNAARKGSPNGGSTSPGAAVTSRPHPKEAYPPLSELLASLPPDDLLAALQAQAFTPPARTHTSTGAGGGGRVVPIDRFQLLAACQIVSSRKLGLGQYRAEHLVVLAEVLAGRCRGLDGAAAVVGSLAEFLLGCSSREGARRFLSLAAREALAVELPQRLPRLLPALAAVGYSGQEAWTAAARLMHTHLRSYSGDHVAALVRALVEVDAGAAAPPSGGGSSTGSSSTGSSGTGSSSSSGGLGVRQLAHPAMRIRLQSLARDGGITGDGSAAVLLGLVVSGAALEMDQLAALLRRALQEHRDLSPPGCVQLLQAVSRYSDRFTDGATEVMSLLEQYQAGLVGALAAGVAAHAAAGRLRPHQLTDAALSFARLRFPQRAFLAELAASTSRDLRSREGATRDVTTALYACALFGYRSAPTADLFAAAAADLTPRLRTLAAPSLARLAWSYAVGGGCGLLPARGQGGPGREVDRFLQELSSTLQSRAADVSCSPEARGLLVYAVRIWRTLEPDLVAPGLLEAVGEPGQQQQQAEQQAMPAHRGNAGREQAGRGSEGGCGDGSEPPAQQQPGSSGNNGSSSSRSRRPPGEGGASRPPVRPRSNINVSELQKEVFRELAALGYRPRMEEQVGMWSVDICVVEPDGGTVAIEVDGPTHYTTCDPPAQLGTTLVRNACLRALGLRVVSLNYRLYNTLRPASRGAMLRQLVEGAAGGGTRRAEGAE